MNNFVGQVNGCSKPLASPPFYHQTVYNVSYFTSMSDRSILGFASKHTCLLKKINYVFYWEIEMPFLEYATSIPKKYCSLPNTFISNSAPWVFNFLKVISGYNDDIRHKHMRTYETRKNILGVIGWTF